WAVPLPVSVATSVVGPDAAKACVTARPKFKVLVVEPSTVNTTLLSWTEPPLAPSVSTTVPDTLSTPDTVALNGTLTVWPDPTRVPPGDLGVPSADTRAASPVNVIVPPTDGRGAPTIASTARTASPNPCLVII